MSQSPQTEPKSGSSRGNGRVTKRSSNAWANKRSCVRCRRQKIRCTGSNPCDACSKRKLSCQFNDSDQKVMVTRGYLEHLQRKSKGNSWERDGVQGSDSEPESINPSSHSSRQRRIDGQRPETRPEPDEAIALTNPLSAGQSTFMPGPNGRLFYLGTSSNWSFTRRILCMAYEYLHHVPPPARDLIFDGNAYDLGWNGSRTDEAKLSTPALPTVDHAIYLINTVKFHCGQMFHLFDDETFMGCLYRFYEEPRGVGYEHDLWYIHFLLIIAFGKAFISKKNQGKQPPGADFFVKALQLLPDIFMLWQNPVQSTEILCCIALYLQCVDLRAVAHNYIGQAIRMAMTQGMHTDMPIHHLGEHLVERSRRAWWTAYVLDREMTSLLGLPQSVVDDDIHPQLPSFAGSTQRSAALNMQIKLSRLTATINRTVYGIDGKLRSKFLRATKSVLADIAGVADELQHTFPLHLDNGITGLSRASANLHLLYHRCIILATRPLLLCFLKLRLESSASSFGKLQSSENVRNLIQMCVDSSIRTIVILEHLQTQGLLEVFLPFDLESLAISTVNLLVAPSLDPQMFENGVLWLKQAHSLFDEMITAGNQVAVFRKTELQNIDDMLRGIQEVHRQPEVHSIDTTRPQGSSFEYEPLSANPLASITANMVSHIPVQENGALYENGIGDPLTSAQVMDMANSIDTGDAEWMSQAIVEHSIW
ncbi:Zn(II)2Cys6 transcription factor [Hypoxylon sp. EC38]|nr:Zn(II)2Cys6 transcription factor [Hypoxylon sp. EC38]